MDTLWNLVETTLGLEVDNPNSGQMAARAIATFVFTIIILRLGAKRLFGKATAFDFIVSIMIGSILSRAITGSSPVLATWAAGATLVALHWLLAWLTARVDWIGPLVKGNPATLIRDGEVRTDAMRESHVSRHDLEQGLLAQGHLPNPSAIALARLERDGTISVVAKENPPRVLEVTVVDGVQTVRVALE